jgi:hypothetical protein
VLFRHTAFHDRLISIAHWESPGPRQEVSVKGNAGAYQFAGKAFTLSAKAVDADDAGTARLLFPS